VTEKSIAERRFEMATQARSQEIELFWKRSLFFWGFISSAFIGYASTLDKNPPAALTLSFFGFFCSLAWTLLNRGSKYWQENWEMKVAREAETMLGDLFWTPETGQYKGAYSGFRFSVSRLAIALSDFTLAVWTVLIAIQGWLSFGNIIPDFDLVSYFIVGAILTFILAVAMVMGSLPVDEEMRRKRASTLDRTVAHKRFVRWQKNTREQLSSANRLFLTYAAALLALQVGVLANTNVTTVPASRLFLTAGGAAVLSFALGIGVLISRLVDVRATMHTARDLERTGALLSENQSRKTAARFGRVSWFAFWSQAISFGLAAISMVFWAYLAFSAKLH
jgi:hypothetical protein